jgi:hypothetical protein
MSILIDPDSAEAKERVKWEAQYTQYGPGARPYVKRDYPMLLHKAGRPAGGLGAAEIVEMQEVGSEQEAEVYRQRGFRPTPLEAIEHWEAEQTLFAELAAERAWEVKHGRHGEKAQQEIVRAEAAAVDHLPSVPVTPIKPHNRESK